VTVISKVQLRPQTDSNSKLQGVVHSIAYREGHMAVMSYLVKILIIVFLTAFGQIVGLNQNVVAERWLRGG